MMEKKFALNRWITTVLVLPVSGLLLAGCGNFINLRTAGLAALSIDGADNVSLEIQTCDAALTKVDIYDAQSEVEGRWLDSIEFAEPKLGRFSIPLPEVSEKYKAGELDNSEVKLSFFTDGKIPIRINPFAAEPHIYSVFFVPKDVGLLGTDSDAEYLGTRGGETVLVTEQELQDSCKKRS